MDSFEQKKMGDLIKILLSPIPVTPGITSKAPCCLKGWKFQANLDGGNIWPAHTNAYCVLLNKATLPSAAQGIDAVLEIFLIHQIRSSHLKSEPPGLRAE